MHSKKNVHKNKPNKNDKVKREFNLVPRKNARLGLLIPDKVRMVVPYTVLQSFSNTLSPFAIFVYQINGPKLPRSATGAAAINWTNLSLLYTEQRTLGSRVEVVGSNAEPSMLEVSLIFSPTDPTSAITTQAILSSYSLNDLNVHTTASASGGLDKMRLTASRRMEQIAGTKAVYTDDTYRSLMTTVPTDALWCTLGINNSIAVNLQANKGLQATLTIWFDLELSGRKLQV
jgi:hypothetical protein